MAQLKGFVTHIIYRNNGNGYTVFELNTGDEITCVGTFQSLEEGEILELEGDFTERRSAGRLRQQHRYYCRSREHCSSC